MADSRPSVRAPTARVGIEGVEMIEKGAGERREEEEGGEDAFQGIVINDGGWKSEDWTHPRISAFIWGGKVRPTPILAYGRWKGAA